MATEVVHLFETDEEADWLRRDLPPHVRNLATLRLFLMQHGISPDRFKQTALYKQVKGRYPWMAQL